jgi:3-phosphoshikimate 1-carboxyvinyltransferase
MDRLIRRVSSFQKSIIIPPDKSITHRGIILGAIATGATILRNPLICEDTLSTLKCVKELGVDYEIGESSIVINSPGFEKLREPVNILDAGNSGTTMRLLSGVLAAFPFKSIITGDKSLKRRPMKRIIEPLDAMGAKVKSDNNHPPLEIFGGELKPIDYNLEIPSAQVKSAIIFAAVNTKGKTTIHEKIHSRDHTERMLKAFEGNIEKTAQNEGFTINIAGRQELSGANIDIPGDFSSAAFFIGLSLFVPESQIVMENIGLNPTRTGMLKIFEEQDVIGISDFKIICGEPRGTITTKPKKVNPFRIKREEIPSIVDEIPILCVIAAQIDGVSVIEGARELRYKESDRIEAIKENIQRMGGNVDVKENDDIIIKGSTPLKGAEINSLNDHRICMAFSIAGMIADGETIIKDSESVNYSFPGFFDIVESLF